LAGKHGKGFKIYTANTKNTAFSEFEDSLLLAQGFSNLTGT
jgi:hypothetical protein